MGINQLLFNLASVKILILYSTEIFATFFSSSLNDLKGDLRDRRKISHVMLGKLINF